MCMKPRWNKRSHNYNNEDEKQSTTDLCFSSPCFASNRSTKVLTRVVSSVTRIPRLSSWSSTTSRRFALLLELRQVSPIIRAAATENRKPSANALAPFSIALKFQCMQLVPYVHLNLWLLHALDFRERLDVPSWFSQNIRAQLGFRAIHELCELYAESAESLMPIVPCIGFWYSNSKWRKLAYCLACSLILDDIGLANVCIVSWLLKS